MKIKQSKTLERLVLRGMELYERSPIGLPIDAIFLVMLEGENCHATHILRRALKDWELYQIKMRLRRLWTSAEQKSSPDGNERAVALETLFEGLAHICRETITPDKEEILNTGHLLLFAMEQGDAATSQILADYRLVRSDVVEEVRNLPATEEYYVDMNALQGGMRAIHIGSSKPHERADGLHSVEGEDAVAEGDTLEKYGLDLTAAARRGEIDPVVGREAEIGRVIQILGRRKKNNPILIGEAGVGKSAIVEGLALRIVAGEVPSSLSGKRIFSLDVAALVAGTKYRGEFEERISKLLRLLANDKKTILFIDEIHNIVGAGSTQGSLDTANILKPALARGGVRCIGATTLAEFRESIERDGALERRFQKVMVEQTTAEQTLRILHNIKEQYEQHHGVSYTEDALRACVELTERYVADRHFPDKAIDLMDEVGSQSHIFGGEPQMLVELERQLLTVESEKRQAAESMEYERAARARLREIALRSRIEECRSEWEASRRAHPVRVEAEDVRRVVGVMTGIPTESLSLSDKERLAGLADRLAARVVGQNRAVEQLARAIIRSRTGLSDPSKPVGVFMFVGPTGVGKTLLAKELAAALFDRDDALLRIDMSEYAEQHNISRMIGSPPGYVGYNEGGQLTEAIRHQPYSVILLDEIEKAHPEVWNVMLQIFDDGHLTDGLGHRVDFRNTVIIMTSNVGSRNTSERIRSVGFTTSADREREQQRDGDHYRRAIEQRFAPEFINRIDDILIFDSLSVAQVEQIANLELSELFGRIERLGYRAEISVEARERLAELGYDPDYGVRPLKREITRLVEEPLAEMIVAGRIASGELLRVELMDGAIRLRAVRHEVA